jgi:hypothetical protein
MGAQRFGARFQHSAAGDLRKESFGVAAGCRYQLKPDIPTSVRSRMEARNYETIFRQGGRTRILEGIEAAPRGNASVSTSQPSGPADARSTAHCSV